MQFLRQNTATRVTVGPFLDATDGVTPEVALTVTNDHLTLVVDDGGVPTLVLDADATASGGSNDMVHVTNDDAGYYDLELTAAQTNYVGRAKLSINDTDVHCPVFHEFTILPANVYDAMIGTDKLDVNAAELGGTSQTGRDVGASVLLSVGTGAGQLNVSGGKAPATLAAADVTNNLPVDLQTIKTRAVNDPGGTVTINVNVGTTQPVNFTGTGATAYVKSDVVMWLGVAPLALSSQKVQSAPGTVDANLTQIKGVNVTESVGGQIASAFNTFFDVASGVAVTSLSTYAGTDTSGVTEILSRLPDATAGAAGGLLIAGSNAATTFATLTVTAGNLNAQVKGMDANVITAAAIATDAIAAAKIAADAVTKIQSGLAMAATALSNATWTDAKAGYLTGDAFVRLGAPVGASISADLAAVKTISDKFDGMIVLDGAVYRYTANALELAPAGGGGNVTVGDITQAALAKFCSVNTGESVAADGSVAKISQGAAGGNVTVGDITQAALAKFATTDTGVTATTSNSVVDLAGDATTGIGGTAVNHNTGGTDNMRYVDSNGAGIGDATVIAYVKTDYDAGTYTKRGETTTEDDGRWSKPLMLNSGVTYTIVIEKSGEYAASTKEITVA